MPLEPFLGPIGQSAAQNMKIIQQALQPFFQWLDSVKPGGGLQIFQELEAIFTSHLSGATTAGIQAIELFFKTVGQLDPNSGGFSEGRRELYEQGLDAGRV